MHSHSPSDLVHSHTFLGERHDENERRTWVVVALTLAIMVAEIAGGTITGSLALVADGWHMGTHAAALTISAAAYRYARRHVGNARFAFGTGKVGELAAYTSAVVLAMIALLIAYESVVRLLNPISIAYGEAIVIAAVGLAVNLLSAWLLRDGNDHHGHVQHGHDHDHNHNHNHDHAAPEGAAARDLNLRAAYVHVLADAATSVLAIAGLLVAWSFGWRFMDPLVGLVGAAVIAVWFWGLLRDAGGVLVDAAPDAARLAPEVRGRLERDGDRVTDLHLWQVGPGHLACIAAVVSDRPLAPSAYKARLADVPGLSHVTVEVEPCPADHPHRHAA